MPQYASAQASMPQFTKRFDYARMFSSDESTKTTDGRPQPKDQFLKSSPADVKTSGVNEGTTEEFAGFSCMDVAYTDNIDLPFPDLHVNWVWEQDNAEYQFFSPNDEASVSNSDESQRLRDVLASSIKNHDSATRARFFPREESSKSNSIANQRRDVCDSGYGIADALSLSETEFVTANRSYLDAGVWGDHALEYESPQHPKTDSPAISYDDSVVCGVSNIRSFCPYPGCSKSFGRKYEAQRHYNSIHSPVTTFQCTYPHCSRSTGFTRKDKWMAHERNHYKHDRRFARQ